MFSTYNRLLRHRRNFQCDSYTELACPFRSTEEQKRSYLKLLVGSSVAVFRYVDASDCGHNNGSRTLHFELRRSVLRLYLIANDPCSSNSSWLCCHCGLLTRYKQSADHDVIRAVPTIFLPNDYRYS